MAKKKGLYGTGFTYDPYKQSNAVNLAEKKKNEYSSEYDWQKDKFVNNLWNNYNTINNSKPGEWNGGQYGKQYNDAINAITNRDKFKYDLNGDMLYQQYKDQYMNLGNLAMQDTIGQASALTGGYANSYAQTAGQQTYQGYLNQLNDRIPELYQLALNSYNAEGERLMNNYGVLSDAYNKDYGQYRDKVSDWNANVDRAYNIYTDARNYGANQYNTNRQFYSDDYYQRYNQDYGKYTDDRNMNFGIYGQGVTESQFAREMALKQAQLAEQKRQFDVQQANKKSGGSSSGGSSSGGSSSSGGKTKDTTFSVDTSAYKTANSNFKAWKKSGGIAQAQNYAATLIDEGYDSDAVMRLFEAYFGDELEAEEEKNKRGTYTGLRSLPGFSGVKPITK